MSAGVTAVYAALGFAWVRGDLDPFWSRASDVAAGAIFIGVHLLVGFAIGRWWALGLCLVPVAFGAALALGGYEGPGREPLPPWFLPLLFLPVAAAALALGVGARRMVALWRTAA